MMEIMIRALQNWCTILNKHVIAAELQVTPDARFLAGQLATRVSSTLWNWEIQPLSSSVNLIVDVRVANENVVQVLPVFRRSQIDFPRFWAVEIDLYHL